MSRPSPESSSEPRSFFEIFSVVARLIGPTVQPGTKLPDPGELSGHLCALRLSIPSTRDPRLLWISERRPADWQLCAVAIVVFVETLQHLGHSFGRVYPGCGVPLRQLERAVHALGFRDAKLNRRCAVVRRRLLSLEIEDHEAWIRLTPHFSPLGEMKDDDDGDELGEGLEHVEDVPDAVDAASPSHAERPAQTDVNPCQGGGTGAGSQRAAKAKRSRPRGSTPREENDAGRPLRSRADYVELAMGLARALMEAGCPDVPVRPLGPPRGGKVPWDRSEGAAESPARLRRQLARMEAALQRMDGWIDRDPEHPVARLRAEHGLTSRLVLALWILLIDRLDCGDEHVGISLQALLGMVGLHQPGTAAPLLERFGREGPLVRDDVIRFLDERGRAVEARVAMTHEFAERLLGEPVSLAPYVGPSVETEHRPGGPHRRTRRGDAGGPEEMMETPPARPLVLPPQEREALDRAIAQVPLRRRVAEEMGFGELLGYGLGSVFLFEGEPGTGKTLAASVVARELGRPLLKVPTARLLNAYVGATEERIESVFKRATECEAVLLLDEADSLLGSREQAVRSWEITQVNTLLHCMERFDGVVILTTNFVARLDRAVERRLSLRLRFPRPGQAERRGIWESLVGARFCLEDVELSEVARRHPLTGSQIKTAVLDLATIAVERQPHRVTASEVEDAVARAKRSTAALRDAPTAGF